MKRLHPLLAGLCCLIATAQALADHPGGIPLSDGDRVVLLGDTLIERDQKYGYLETLLTRRYPGTNVVFRNLGWSGDTVFGEARAGFGTQPDGFRQLKEHVLALKPTVLIVGYGMNESFEGEAGLPRFVEGLNTLLDALAPTRARVVLLSPISHEAKGRPLPDPTRHNQDLERYSRAIRKVAGKRDAAFVSLLLDPESLSKRGIRGPLTDNGIHLTDFGYAVIADAIVGEFRPGTLSLPWEVDIAVDGGTPKREGHANPKVSGLESNGRGIRFESTDLQLPAPRLLYSKAVEKGGEASSTLRNLKVKGLAPGRYALRIDGRAILSAEAEGWARGETLPPDGPEFDQVEALRATINAKNLLYFHRWRPQNETYLFGFRKYEQGNNAREIPLFDPLVEEKEKEIARLRVPATHVYELVRESEVGK